MDQQKLRPVNTLWVGQRLTFIEQLSLRSFVDSGHVVNLYVYDEVRGVPPDVVVRDARSILPAEETVRLRRDGSTALFSDKFRYHLMLQDVGYWVDCDVVCLKPIDYIEPFVFGWQTRRMVGSSVLFIDSESVLLRDLVDFCRDEFPNPPWMNAWERLKLSFLRRLGAPRHVSAMTWGIWGPKLIRAFTKRHGLIGLAKPQHVFFPVHWNHARALFDPQFSADRFIRESTRTVHLWNELIKDLKHRPAPRGSFIELACRKYGV